MQTRILNKILSRSLVSLAGFLGLLLTACTAPGGGLPTGSLGTAPLDAPGSVQATTESGADGSGIETAAATPDRQGSKIDLDPHDEFFPVYIPDLDNGVWYLYEECFPNHEPRKPACKYFTIPCDRLDEFTIEYHPENSDRCRVHEFILLWGDCSSLKYCSPLQNIPQPNPALPPGEAPATQHIAPISGQDALKFKQPFNPMVFEEDGPWPDEDLQ